MVLNDVRDGDELTEFGKPFWEPSLEKGWRLLERAHWSHIVTGRHARRRWSSTAVVAPSDARWQDWP